MKNTEEYELWLRNRYPSGMPVYYDIDELEKDVRARKVSGAIGIPYHVIMGGPAIVGMASKDQPRWENERRLKRLSMMLAPDGEIIVLTAINSWAARWSYG